MDLVGLMTNYQSHTRERERKKMRFYEFKMVKDVAIR